MQCRYFHFFLRKSSFVSSGKSLPCITFSFSFPQHDCPLCLSYFLSTQEAGRKMITEAALFLRQGVDMCPVGASNTPKRARPRPQVVWLHTSLCLYLFTTASRIRQYLPKIATSPKGLRKHSARHADPMTTAFLYGAIPVSGCETTGKHGYFEEERRQLPLSLPA